VTPTRDSSTSFGFAQDKLLRSLGMTGLSSNLFAIEALGDEERVSDSQKAQPFCAIPLF